MFNPIEIQTPLLVIVLRGIAVMGLDELNHFIILYQPTSILLHICSLSKIAHDDNADEGLELDVTFALAGDGIDWGFGVGVITSNARELG